MELVGKKKPEKKYIILTEIVEDDNKITQEKELYVRVDSVESWRESTLNENSTIVYLKSGRAVRVRNGIAGVRALLDIQ